MRFRTSLMAVDPPSLSCACKINLTTSLQNLAALQQLMSQNPQATLGAAQVGQFGTPQIPLNIPAYGGSVQQPLMNQPLGAYGGVQQPLMQQPLGNFGATPISPITPTVLGAGFGGVGGTIPAVLPQNFGNPPAQFGQLQQPGQTAEQQRIDATAVHSHAC